MMTPQSDEQARIAREANERLAENLEKAKAAAEKGVDDRLAARDKQVADYYERKADEQPTPTQRECDLARMGILVDDKEDDGSEWQEEMQQRMMEGQLNNPYVTRELEVDESTGEAKPRRKKRRGR